jgi:hypothetical protein
VTFLSLARAAKFLFHADARAAQQCQRNILLPAIKYNGIRTCLNLWLVYPNTNPNVTYAARHVLHIET